MKNKKRRNKSDFGDDFVAPDGGWGWVVCIAAGCIILTILPIWQSFGLIFRDRLIQLGLTNSEITTIINIQPAVTSCLGLFSGAIFRRFTIRQVTVLSGMFISFGVFLASIADSFLTYIFSISIIFGGGMGLATISTFLAINTYFYKKRRTARSFTLTIGSIGSIVVPHLTNFLISHYDVSGTVLIYCGISMHSFALALLYQPVQWHSKKKPKNENLIKENRLCPSENNEEKEDNIIKEISPLRQENSNKINNKNDILEFNNKNIQDNINNNELKKNSEYMQRLKKFFDLDLLNDLIYVNLAIGITLTTFSEQNFSILTPFFLSDFQFTKTEIASAMSTLAIADLITRFLIPFITDKIDWNNRIFFIIGCIGSTIVRIVVANIPSFNLLLIMFGFMGICKGIRLVFIGLVIPDHVPLKRLPAAVGFRQFTTGVFTIMCGPIVGLIRDTSDPTFMLYFLSFISVIPVLTWSIEMTYIYVQKRKELKTLELNESENKSGISFMV